MEEDEVPDPASEGLDHLRRAAADLQGRSETVEEPWLLGWGWGKVGQEGCLLLPLPPLPHSGVNHLSVRLAGARKKLDRGAGALDNG